MMLNIGDNVVTCTQTLSQGEEVMINGTMVGLKSNVWLGHKLAARAIAKGELIIKYGVPIGTATENIALGDHVHTHNITSNYIPTFLHD